MRWTPLVLCQLMIALLVASHAGAQTPRDLPTSVYAGAGAAAPFADALAKTSASMVVGVSHRVVGRIEADVNLSGLIDGRTENKDNKGEGTFATTAILMHAGARVHRSKGAAFGFYGGGLSVAHYKSQLGAYNARCASCGGRNGVGAYGSVGVGRTLQSKRDSVVPWLGLEAAVDGLAMSGTFGLSNPVELKTKDVWVTVRVMLGFGF